MCEYSCNGFQKWNSTAIDRFEELSTERKS